MSIWDQIQHIEPGAVCLVPRNDGTGLFVSGTVVAKDEAKRSLEVIDAAGAKHTLDFAKDNPSLFPPPGQEK